VYLDFSIISDILGGEGLRADKLPNQSDLKRSSCNNSIWVLKPSINKNGKYKRI
tara:strand:- start:359 stop:520 length:162 start_codon:yes stop_codon:yes gene_type:complete